MERFATLTAVAAPIDAPNVDTDRIIPARFLRYPRSVGYERFLFHDEGAAFVLREPAYREARILVVADNFGCGSSREGAVWAIAGAGVRALVGPSFGDIFAGNCARNGVLAATLAPEVVTDLRRRLRARPGATMTVDLPAQTVTGPDGAVHRFEIDPYRKTMLEEGLDDIGLTERHEPAIAAYERRRREETPWLP